MPFFYYDGIIDPTAKICLKGSETRHIRLVRKIRPNEKIELQDTTYNRYDCVVTLVKNSYIECDIVQKINPPPEPKENIHLALAIPKEKALDTILQKSVELGAHALHLFESDFSQRLPKGESRMSKYSRWTKILQESCKQCNRLKPPELHLVDKLDELCTNFNSDTTDIWLLHPGDVRTSPEKLEKRWENTILIVGPEGGFSDKDLDVLPKNYLSLGPRLLRSDTAAITALSLFQFYRGDMNLPVV